MDNRRMFKLTMLIKRVSGMTEAEFHKYWSESHVPIVNAWLAKHGVVQYVQYHTPSQQRQESGKVWATFGGNQTLDFDGMVQLVVPNIECLEKALGDPYYEEFVQPDETKFIDGTKSLRTYGWEETYIVDNKPLV